MIDRKFGYFFGFSFVNVILGESGFKSLVEFFVISGEKKIRVEFIFVMRGLRELDGISFFFLGCGVVVMVYVFLFIFCLDFRRDKVVLVEIFGRLGLYKFMY